MRKRYEIQQSLGCTPIPEVFINPKSRHEMARFLMGLQYIFVHSELRESVLSVVEEVVLKGKKATGRPGMPLWEILVLGVVRLGLDADYDRLEDLANSHKYLRGILGVDLSSGFGPAKTYELQTLKDNVSLLDEESLSKINTLIVEAGHKALKKKGEEALAVKADSYVVETNVHYPTDVNLLYDSGRKCLDMIRKASKKLERPLSGWRKVDSWHNRLRKYERRLTQILGAGGRNRQERIETATTNYLEVARKIHLKIESSKQELAQHDSLSIQAIATALEMYQTFMEKHIDLVERRLLDGELIPHDEKVFSIFEPHTEWINKGKKHKKVELGIKVLIATDQHHFILAHEVMQNQQDVHRAVPIAKKICTAYKVEKLQSISFDRGFYSQPNFENLQNHAQQVILPKKGNKNSEEYQRETQKSFIKLRHKHSAVEANINQLEHNGLNRCPDKGIKAFKRYVAWGVLAYNIHRLGKVLIDQQKENEKRKIRKLQKLKDAA